jgi:predicted nucleic acid-binding Zn ribbon protein
MAGSGRNPSEFIHIKEIIGTLLPQCRKGGSTELARIRHTWNSALPGEISENAQPAALKNDILLVHVKSSTVAHQLRFLTEEIKHHLNAPTGARPIHTLRFKIGNL